MLAHLKSVVLLEVDPTTISHLPLFCCIVGLNICPHGVGNVWGRAAAELCHLHCINQPHVLCISCTCTIPPLYYKHCTMLQLHIPPNHHPQMGRLKERRRRKEILKNGQTDIHLRVTRWQNGQVCTNTYYVECYLILESSLPQQPPSDGYIIMLWVQKFPTYSAFSE